MCHLVTHEVARRGCCRGTQDDVRHRRFLDPAHRAYVPDFGAYIELPSGGGFMSLSRQLVLFCVKRRKAWRLLQSKAGVVSKDYPAHRALLATLESGEMMRSDVLKRGRALLEAEEDLLKG